MKLEKIKFSSMKDVWKYRLWQSASRILPMDPQQYIGSTDNTILEKYEPSFFAIKRGNVIIGAVSGHRTSNFLYRLRGLYVDDIDEKDEIRTQLVAAIKSQARMESCKHIWEIVDEENELEEFGFKITDRFKDNKFFSLYTL